MKLPFKTLFTSHLKTHVQLKLRQILTWTDSLDSGPFLHSTLDNKSNSKFEKIIFLFDENKKWKQSKRQNGAQGSISRKCFVQRSTGIHGPLGPVDPLPA